MLASSKRGRVPSELGAAQRFGRPEGREREAALGKALSLQRTDLHNSAHSPRNSQVPGYEQRSHAGTDPGLLFSEQAGSSGKLCKLVK